MTTYWRIRFAHLSLVVLALLFGSALAQTDTDGDSASRTCELGVTLALLGQPAAAESAFTSLLSRAPGDARAFNNLGNLAMMRGEATLALSFYERAHASDSTDAGIRLNEATALLILGEEDLATARAMDGVRGVGGAQAAARLLGLQYTDTTSHAGRAVQRPAIHREEMLQLLRTAAARVPRDSSRTAASDTTVQRPNRRAPKTRPAGARAGASPDLATQIYWKR